MLRTSSMLAGWVLAFCIAMLTARSARAAKDYVWVEGEQPASANVKWNNAGSSHEDWLSGGKWLTVTVDEGKVEKEVPDEGVLLTYALPVETSGRQEVWARLGFEFARAEFQWKLDDGGWKTVTPDELTTDAMELDFFAEAAWLKLSDVDAAAGNHTLSIRIPKKKDAHGKYEHILFGLDAICLSSKPFVPHARFKPDEAWRTQKDDEAARHVFEMLPQALDRVEMQVGGIQISGGDFARWDLPLGGLWEVTRDDEQMPGEVAAPIKDLPAHPFWGAIAVPSDKNVARPDLMLAHRLWYRTKVSIPKEAAGRSFFLTFPQNNLNTTVYVNGVYCGFDKNPLARVQIDVSKGIKPGAINEICVGVRDAWYGRSRDPNNPMKLRRTFNLPEKFFHDGFQELAYPIWNQSQSGILQTPTLTAAGGVYASDVFVKTSVEKMEATFDVTVFNPTDHDADGLMAFMVCDKPNSLGKMFEGENFNVPAGQQKTFEVTRPFKDAMLWWPDQPKLYTVRTMLLMNHAVADAQETTFGFRQWTIDGIHFKLNGIPFHGWCDQHAQDDPASWLAFQRKTHQQMMRFWGTEWMGMSPDAALDFFDKNGVVVRRSGVLDGEAIGYHADEPDPAMRKLYGDSPIKMDLILNWRDQVCAQVKGERNHPSVMIWSIENEWLYINCINLYGGLMDLFEAEETKTAQAVQQVDPTRPVMCDGGAACKAQTLPVCGNHYIGGPLPEYPGLAYGPNVDGGGRGRWQWDQKRPRFAGEDWFIAGNHPEFSCIGGSAALTGKTASLPAAGKLIRILQEGYRWADYGAWDFWMNSTDADGSQYIGFSPRAALVREWNYTFGSGQQATRTVALFNDTHDPEPITFAWKLTVDGKMAASQSHVYNIAPGGREIVHVVLPLPNVARRTTAQWTLSLSVGAKEVFQDVKPLSILATTPQATRPQGLAGLTADQLLVFDPAGAAAKQLEARSIPFTALADLKTLPESGRVLLIGKDAIDASQKTSTMFAAWASRGRTVVVLEQKNPLEFAALPVQMEPAKNVGRTAFIEDADHPAMAGLQSDDFFTWGDDEIVYRDAYVKPTRGGKSLIECGELLRNSALVEVPVDKGLLLLCQLPLEEKLAVNAVAQVLLGNLLDYAAQYKLTVRPVTLTASAGSELAKVADTIGLTYTAASDPLAAIASPSARVAIVDASPENLAKLAENLEAVKAFNEAGGWIVFNHLTPPGLASYNKIVGVDHMIRPFKRERVALAATRSPLAAGIAAGDVTMYSSKRIFPWADGNYTVSDEFSYIVDYDEVAPFGQSPFFAYDNITNGFTNVDGWPFIINFPVNADHSPSDIPINFPTAQTFTEFTWIGNSNYWVDNKVNLIFDGDRKSMLSFDVQSDSQPRTFAINPPRQAKQVTLEIAGWQELPGKGALHGIDNIYLKVSRPPAFYQSVRPFLNIGGMMEYPRGKGGIVLCNLLLQPIEEVPANAEKKRAIFATLLRNLKASFAGSNGGDVIVGENLTFTPIDISHQANQYRTEAGWFGDKAFTFADLPTGRQTMAGVMYDIFEFATSPVPTAIMLGGPGVPNRLPREVRDIPVNQKADALFFLQAARIDHRRSPRDVKAGEKWDMAHYVIHYADGKTVDVPIYSEIDVDNFRQTEPRVISGAQIAWTKKYEGTRFSAVAYSKQWNNPRPDETIASIDLVYGPDHAGVPVLLAVTAGKKK